MKKLNTLLILFIFVLISGNCNIIHKYKNKNLPVDIRVNDLLSRMTIEEKAGQMAMIARDSIIYNNDENDINDFTDIKTYNLGSILSGGGSTPAVNNPVNWIDMYNDYQKSALQTRLGIPMIYGIDAVHGHNNVKGAVIFPHNIGLGAANDPDLVRKIARATAVEVAATGIDWNFAPCIAVPQDERWGRTYEGFSEVPGICERLGAAAIQGYQGDSLADPLTILACAKHFGGDGGTFEGKDRGDVVLTENDLYNIHLKHYEKMIEAGTGSIMISFNSWNGEKVHGSKHLITDILKNKMNFKGIIVSDWAAVKELPGTPEQQIEKAINAGIDMIMVPDDYRHFTKAIVSLVKEQRIDESRIDEAVSRILRIKFMMGLFENPMADYSFLDKIGCKEHRELAKEAVRKSLVLLKNRNNLLPLSKDIKHIYVAGYKSDDIGIQCGGWTIEWQGKQGNITEGTTILQAIQNTVSDSTKVTYSPTLANVQLNKTDADAIVVVAGETPYAEFNGDDYDLELTIEDRLLINKAKKSGIPCIVILISGRPMIITDEINKSDSFIAAWLPGTEAQGIADVLFGDYSPTGKLSYTWPSDISQLPINEGDGKEGALFPFGFGLTY